MAQSNILWERSVVFEDLQLKLTFLFDIQQSCWMAFLSSPVLVAQSMGAKTIMEPLLNLLFTLVAGRVRGKSKWLPIKINL